MGFPLVLKLSSETITHKTDVGGVKLNLKTLDEVVEAFDEIKENVSRLAGPEHFGGVTVQRMILRGLRNHFRQFYLPTVWTSFAFWNRWSTR